MEVKNMLDRVGGCRNRKGREGKELGARVCLY